MYRGRAKLEFNYAGEARNYFRNSAIETVVLRAQCYCMYGLTYSKSLDQPGEVANPARGQLNRENLENKYRGETHRYAVLLH